MCYLVLTEVSDDSLSYRFWIHIVCTCLLKRSKNYSFFVNKEQPTFQINLTNFYNMLCLGNFLLKCEISRSLHIKEYLHVLNWRMMMLFTKHFCFVFIIFVRIFLARADNNCYPRWLPGSKSRIRVTFVPLEKSISRWERLPLLNFLSMSIIFPKDMKEILACDIDSRTKIEVR